MLKIKFIGLILQFSLIISQKLNIFTRNFSIFTSCYEKNFSGYEIDLFHKISAEINWQFKKDYEFFCLNNSQTIENYLKNDKDSVFIGGNIINSEISKYSTYRNSLPTIKSSLSLIKKSKQIINQENIFSFFSFSFFISLIFLIFFISFLLFFFEKKKLALMIIYLIVFVVFY